MAATRVCAVLGAGGEGIGGHVAERFAKAGFAVALMGRTKEKLAAIEGRIRASGGTVHSFVVDAASTESIKEAFAAIKQNVGAVDVLVYNAGPQFQRASVLDLSPKVLEDGFRTGCIGALTAAQQVLPDMLAKGNGTVLLTGATASLRGGALFASLAAPKSALRALAQSMARELGPRGIHVAHIIIDGVVDLPGTRAMLKDRRDDQFISPKAVAEQYYQLYAQDKSAWTLELDVRPFTESF